MSKAQSPRDKTRVWDRILRLRSQAEAIVGRSVGVESLLPEIVPAATGMDTAQSQDVLGAGLAPEHARLFAARADDGFAASLDDARADKQPLAPKGAVLHSFHIMHEVVQLFLDRLSLRFAQTFGAGFFNEVFDAVAQ